VILTIHSTQFASRIITGAEFVYNIYQIIVNKQRSLNCKQGRLLC